MSTIEWDRELDPAWAIWDIGCDVFRFNPHADIRITNEAVYVFEIMRSMITDQPDRLHLYVTTLGRGIASISQISAEIWMQIANWVYLWGHPSPDADPHWLADFRDLLDQDEVWRQTVAEPTDYLYVSPEFMWECFCRNIDLFPHHLADPSAAPTLNSYRNRNFHPGLFAYVIDLELDNNDMLVKVTYRPREQLNETFIQFP